MRVHLRVFSYLREYLPPHNNVRGEVDLELPDQASLKDLFIALGFEHHLGMQIFDTEVDHTFQVLVNQMAVYEYTHPLVHGDKIVLFPPMAGG